MPSHTAIGTADGGGDDHRLTTSEWTFLERYHRRGYNESWTQKDKIILTSALKKAYGQPNSLSAADLAKVLKWIKEGPKAQE